MALRVQGSLRAGVFVVIILATPVAWSEAVKPAETDFGLIDAVCTRAGDGEVSLGNVRALGYDMDRKVDYVEVRLNSSGPVARRKLSQLKSIELKSGQAGAEFIKAKLTSTYGKATTADLRVEVGTRTVLWSSVNVSVPLPECTKVTFTLAKRQPEPDTGAGGPRSEAKKD